MPWSPLSWSTLLQPDLILGTSVLGLTPELLEHYGLKGLVLDVDETLVPVTMAEASIELQEWVASVKQTTDLWLVSNNISQNRIRRIAESLSLPYILGAGKPSRRKLRQAVQAMNLPSDQIAMVGDRLFTDVIAGNRLGMFTILVEPMINPAKEGQRYLLRDIEVWLSQILGATLPLEKQNATNLDKS
ncbi:YqeG family HAD IIIA-type phosphatase [Thermocoleostomius sinensis]|jgi:HAD superfamily phosphatase (TIGR01668 family)|uniref:YqeG family HAD IIIA-type phosphatase n=1 Tax=Thermocoleostomius sinensis A174 TaxID=2016057 RepID=A0A9E8ZEV0_9CYAN|nr:YqeG family HAD IIIA-type phosphatase [Thermocoleostomius sinensis]WAL62079.1 YqeG family HAD IIIA-type phosphatase [Thermocoleostomius sinensis A174]